MPQSLWTFLTTLCFLVATIPAFPQKPASALYPYDGLIPRVGPNATTPAMTGKHILRLPNDMPEIRCDGTKYKDNLKWESCIDAANTIPRTTDVQTFQQRGPGRTPDVHLPWRWISGLCLKHSH